ncbi:SNARE-associated domain-containing protein [Salinibius halmophilus]|uniref:hypothetical protein n=1 Tax=Salinibius halmophilus TaxID=1853216 RepID=UPI000E6696E8|nr:hypothetical protein [Salinibius halmophilus]
MKFYSTLPITALLALTIVQLAMYWQVIPPGLEMLEALQGAMGQWFMPLIFLVILAESIIYVGFYFPGQFFAVVLVILSNPSVVDIIWLTVSMVAAATLGSLINYQLGKAIKSQPHEDRQFKLRNLLLAMIHMNALAFFMFNQGAERRSIKIVWLAGLINLPYYLLLITGTALLSEQIMQVAESPRLIFVALGVWLAVAITLDVRGLLQRRKSGQSEAGR